MRGAAIARLGRAWRRADDLMPDQTFGERAPVADATPELISHLTGGCLSPQTELVESLVLLLLVLDVLPDHHFIATYGRDEVPSGPPVEREGVGKPGAWPARRTGRLTGDQAKPFTEGGPLSISTKLCAAGLSCEAAGQTR